MIARRIPRRAGMLASELTQCQYLTTKDSIPCNVPVIPSLVKYVQLIHVAVLRIDSFNFSEIQDLREFDLDTYHTLITRKCFHHILRKPSYPAQTSSMISHVVWRYHERVFFFRCMFFI